MNKYPDPAQFILDYSPDLQFKLVRCNATHSELALNDSIPSLGLLSSAYGDETPTEWLKIQFGSLNDFAEVSARTAKGQRGRIADLCGNIKRFGEVSDLRLFDSGNGKWAVFSNGRQLTDVRF